MNIFIYKNNYQIGPYHPDQVKEMLERGELSTEDPVWYEGLAEWLPISAITDLFPPSIPPQTATPVNPPAAKADPKALIKKPVVAGSLSFDHNYPDADGSVTFSVFKEWKYPAVTVYKSGDHVTRIVGGANALALFEAAYKPGLTKEGSLQIVKAASNTYFSWSDLIGKSLEGITKDPNATGLIKTMVLTAIQDQASTRTEDVKNQQTSVMNHWHVTVTALAMRVMYEAKPAE